jgi:hypothetical protein
MKHRSLQSNGRTLVCQPCASRSSNSNFRSSHHLPVRIWSIACATRKLNQGSTGIELTRLGVSKLTPDAYFVH